MAKFIERGWEEREREETEVEIKQRKRTRLMVLWQTVKMRTGTEKYLGEGVGPIGSGESVPKKRIVATGHFPAVNTICLATSYVEAYSWMMIKREC
jgi:hypothetical protein